MSALLSAGDRERLDAFATFLLEANRNVNLTAARDREAVWEHIEDSLTLAPYVRGPLIDIGSGGGFPAIPLEIVTGVEMTLIESLEKKARFLRAAAERFSLPISVEARRAEEAAHDPALRERFASRDGPRGCERPGRAGTDGAVPRARRPRARPARNARGARAASDA